MAESRSFRGDLSLVSTINLLQLIKLASLSGRLLINCMEKSTHFFFTEGKLNYAFSRQDKKRIGQTLLESQLITADQLKASLDYQKKADKRQKLGSIFVKNGYLTQAQLTDIFKREVESVLFETLTWTEGEFRFVDSSPLVEGDIILEEDLEPLILQALVLLDEKNV